MCAMKNNEWKRCMLSMQDSIDNRIGTTRIKPNLASLNNKQSPINGVNKPFMGLFLLP
jgi:hypothetical protein